jgi:hypothetical protein
VDAKLISFGLIEIDGRRFDRDVVLEAGNVRRRKKKPSKAYRDRFGHTPLSADEEIPWSAPRLIVGTAPVASFPSCRSCTKRPSDEAWRSLLSRPRRPAGCSRGSARERLRQSFT